jgi:hypothetical protein
MLIFKKKYFNSLNKKTSYQVFDLKIQDLFDFKAKVPIV